MAIKRQPRLWLRQLRGFSLVELMTALVLLGIILFIIFTALQQTSDVWRQSAGRIEKFQNARASFETVTRTLSQATLNTYWDYLYSGNSSSPSRYIRMSDLHFVMGQTANLVPNANSQGHSVFFQAPLGYTTNTNYSGLASLLNACGFYIVYSSDVNLRPGFLPGSIPIKNRYRLMQLVSPAENLQVYQNTIATNYAWFTNQLANHSIPIADNVIALILWPRLTPQEDSLGNSLTPNYSYNSRLGAMDLVTYLENGTNETRQRITGHQLPPLVQVSLVAIDEDTAARLDSQGQQQSAIFTAFNGLFQNSTLASYQADMSTLRARLTDAGINYRIFTSVVPMRESKWSK